MGLLDTWRKTHHGVGWERLITGLGLCSYFGLKLKAVQLGCAISTLPLVVSINSGVKFKDSRMEKKQVIFLEHLLHPDFFDLIFCKVLLGSRLEKVRCNER